MAERRSLAVVDPVPMEDEGLTTAEELFEVLPVDTEHRHCTNLLWLAIFLLYLAGMVGLSIVGFQNGNPERLIYAPNHEGKLCGADYPSKKYVTYPRANEDLILSGFADGKLDLTGVKFFGVCVEECPMAGDFVCTEAGEALVKEHVTGSVTRDAVINACVNQWYSTIPFGDLCPDSGIRSQCFETIMDTSSVFFRCLPQYVYEKEVLPESACVRYKNVTTITGDVKQLCTVYREVTKITKEQPTAGNILFDTFNTYSVYAQSYLGDLMKAYKPILISGFGVSVGIGLLFVFSLWCCVGVMVWITVICSILASATLTIYCYMKAGIIDSSVLTTIYGALADAGNTVTEKANTLLQISDGNETLSLIPSQNFTTLPSGFTESLDYSTEFTYAAYASTAFTALLILLVFYLVERIVRAIEIFEVASKAIRKNLFLVVIPFISMTFFFAVIAAWAVCTAYIASAGSFEIEQLNKTISIANEETIVEIKYFGSLSYVNIFMAYMFLGLLWILNFLNGITVMTVSGTVLRWFFADEVVKDKEHHTPFPILKSFYTTLRFHLGTIAFASLVLAFIQFIRYLAAAIEKRMSKLEKNNKFLRVMFCAFQCILACVQKFIQFVTRNAYIMTAMYGDPFCTATKNAIVTVTTNLAQVALITFLGDIIQRFGQILITISTGLACWVYLDQFDDYKFGGDLQLNSFIFPVLVSMFCGWFVAAEVLSVYDITVDTLMLSYCQDQRLKKYKAAYREHSSESVKSFVGKHSLKDKELIRQVSMSTIY